MDVNNVVSYLKEFQDYEVGKYKLRFQQLRDAVFAMPELGTKKFDISTQDYIFKNLVLRTAPYLNQELRGGNLPANGLSEMLREIRELWPNRAGRQYSPELKEDIRRRLEISRGVFRDRTSFRWLYDYWRSPTTRIRSNEFADLEKFGNIKQQRVGQRQVLPNTIETKIDTIIINTQATDANGIAQDINKELNFLLASKANYGLI
jgi:hypothetical protein